MKVYRYKHSAPPCVVPATHVTAAQGYWLAWAAVTRQVRTSKVRHDVGSDAQLLAALKEEAQVLRDVRGRQRLASLWAVGLQVRDWHRTRA